MSTELTILLVDDSEDHQVLCRRALRSTGARILTALSAEEGLDLAAREHPGAIVLDYNLPGLNGLGFMERFALLDCGSIPIVMLTGEGNESVAVEAMKAGASDYLVKAVEGGYLRMLPSVVQRACAVHQERMHARRQGELQQAILSTVADGILGVDAVGSILFANAAAERMLLCPASDLVGRHLEELLHDADPRENWNSHPLAQAHDGSVTVNRESDILHRAGGSSFPVAYTASPLDLEGKGQFGWVLVFRDNSERKQAEEVLIKTARYDMLTGLPNRLLFQDFFARSLSRVTRSAQHLALLFLDLDGFKEVNDTLGHLVGDQLLQSVAQRLVKCVRASDLVSRFGGDEFILLLEDCDPVFLPTLSRRILRDLALPFNLGGQTAHITASIGISLYPECGAGQDILIQKADAAMYEVKKTTKNGFRLSSELEFLLKTDHSDMMAKEVTPA